MNCDCHIHMVLDGQDWKAAIAAHREAPNDAIIRMNLRRWQAAGFTYLREGGDRWGVGARARELAPEYGIRLVTPLSPLYKAGHYGSFIGTAFETPRQYAALVEKQKKDGADFIKIMISGLMDFDRFGVLTQEGLEPALIQELVHIAHEEGLAVMAHANGARTGRLPGRGWTLWSTVLIWTRRRCTPCRKMEPCGCPPCLPLEICGARGGFRNRRWRRFSSPPPKMSAALLPWAGCLLPAPMPVPGRFPTEA
jgi:hypothetical protein